MAFYLNLVVNILEEYFRRGTATLLCVTHFPPSPDGKNQERDLGFVGICVFFCILREEQENLEYLQISPLQHLESI